MESSSGTALLLAGNGFVGQRIAVALASAGWRVAVHHTGRRPVPSHPGIASIVADRTPPPIRHFPSSILTERADVAIHCYCMGAEDAAAFVRAFDGRVPRLVLISSCDIYRAYGRFIRTEPGPADATPLDELAPVRERQYPYRSRTTNPSELEHWYEKLEAEGIVCDARHSDFSIVRLPKVYGPGSASGLSTVYGFAHRPAWRWTHGHVENVASAIALVSIHPDASGEVFNLGEEETPTMGERLERLPDNMSDEPSREDYDYRQDLHFDTTKIRNRLGYKDVVNEPDAMKAFATQARLQRC